MSSINLQSFENKEVAEYTYKDIHLDLKPNQNISDFGLHREANTTDIEESRDQSAIKNSIFNIFNTVPGEKLLNPTFGADLKRYLFEPMTKNVAESIGEVIKFSIERFEPRVTIVKIQVGMNHSANEYNITLILEIPTLNNKKTVMSGRLTSNGYEMI
tara:strand:+ start:417 stop:890 length:474 start_codon:yes stop_codon:yes gene_type:complete